MSGTFGRLAGIATLTINGDSFDVVSDLEWSTVRVTREVLKGQTRVEGYSEMPTECFISARLRDRSDYAIQDLNGLTDATIVVQQANGKTILGDQMFQSGELTVNTQEGTFNVRFIGPEVTESTV